MARVLELKVKAEKTSRIDIFKNWLPVKTLDANEQAVSAEKIAVEFCNKNKLTFIKVVSYKMSEGFLIVQVEVL